MGANHDLAAADLGRGRKLGLFDQAKQRVEFSVGVGRGGSGETRAGFFKGAFDAGAVKRLQKIVHSVDLKGADGVSVVGGGEDDLGKRRSIVDKPFEHPEAVQARHLHIKEDDVGSMGLNQVDGFNAVRPKTHDLDVCGSLDQVLELLAGERLVVDDEDAERHLVIVGA